MDAEFDKWLLLLSHRLLLSHPSRRVTLVLKILVTVGKLFITAGIAHRRPPTQYHSEIMPL